MLDTAVLKVTPFVPIKQAATSCECYITFALSYCRIVLLKVLVHWYLIPPLRILSGAAAAALQRYLDARHTRAFLT